MRKATVLAFDFGASSGRAIKGIYEDGHLTYEECHRFENNMVKKDGHLYWDFDHLRHNIDLGIQKAGAFDSLSFDTWGVDYGLLDTSGALLSCPMHYRDSRTDGMVEGVLQHLTKEELYRHTGNQVMQINTLFQLLADGGREEASTLLFMPDLFAYLLCGSMFAEVSIASTSQMLDPTTGQWSDHVLARLGLSQDLLPPLVKSGTVVGQLSGGEKVIAGASHDTQCAITALPNTDPNTIFLSCGTWSLLGCELDAPILTPESLAQNFSNEIGANGKINYLKNITGLWLVQECRRNLMARGQVYSYAQLELEARQAREMTSIINPDLPQFQQEGHIPEKIMAFCSETGQEVPQTTGELIACIYRSLATTYHDAICGLSEMTGKAFSSISLLGGGVQAELLCQVTADICQLPVQAGPVEATALGNMLIQLVALGAISSIDEGRILLGKTEKIARYLPRRDESPRCNL